MELGRTLSLTSYFTLGRRRASGAAFFFLAASPAAAAVPAPPPRPSVLLVTLDTTRDDAVDATSAPAIVGLARSGMRYASAWSSAPLTLPSHASLLSGRDPGAHGLRENGLEALGREVPLVQEAFRAAGYRTAAFVASRILDRRFGLDRGFELYDDRMAAERVGEFGYAERPAAEVAAAAAAWLGQGGAGPRFLWVHFYDPHAPYAPPVLAAERPELERYRAEVAAADRAVGELVARLPERERWLVAVVGDHGEAFGEHGEREHGLLLHQTTLQVPLVLAGPGVPAGRTIATPVATRRLAATLASLAGIAAAGIAGPALPLAAGEEPLPILHESVYPASVHGWSPIAAVTLGELRLVGGPRPRLFDLAHDPAELVDRLATASDRARPLKRSLDAYLDSHPFDQRAPPPDAETARWLASLGYLSGATGRAGTLDPAEGVKLVARFEEAVELQRRGELEPARKLLAELLAKSPDSVPFLARAAALDRAAGRADESRARLRRAIELQPRSEFLHTALGEELLASADETSRATGREHLRAAVRLAPAHAPAWLALAQDAARSQGAAGEERLLGEAVAAGVESGAVHLRLAQLLLARSAGADAESQAARALALLPDWSLAWLVAGEVAEGRGERALAADRYARASQLGGAAGAEAARRLARLRG